MTRSHIALGVTHLIGNALLIWLGYAWLGMSEGTRLHLVGSIVVLFIFAFGTLWLHATALAFFGQNLTINFRTACRTALRRLPLLTVLTLIVALLYAFLSYCYGAFDHIAFLIGSALTMVLRKPVSPARVLSCFHGLIWILRWIVVPSLALPLAARLVSKTTPRLNPRWFYWLVVAALLLLAVWVPLKLIDWVPKVNSFGSEVASFAARMGTGYLLFVAALLTLEFLTSSGKPRASQPNTAVSP